VATTLIVALRRLIVVAIAILFLLIAAVLAYVNPDPIALDIGLMRFDEVSLSLVLVAAFAAGAIFGGAVLSLTLLNHYRERRGLRRHLKRAERELQTTRSLLSTDAD
jgi:uncharacterized integral membrane protein